MSEVDMGYYELRAAEEFERADAASDPVAAEVHRRLANLYCTKAADVGVGGRLRVISGIEVN